MTTPSQAGGGRPDAGRAGGGAYTGVIVIHGIGDEKRNDTLREAVNALGYWYNHEAGLALRPEGPGRLWVEAELTDDPNPDAPASRARVELSPPRQEGVRDDTVRLEVREVWWAESFGVPNVGAALKWARLQYREESSRVLRPVGRRLGPARAASRAPAFETPQAIHYQPHGMERPAPAGDTGATADASAPRAGWQRALLRAALALYSGLQYVWKLLVWTLITPLLYALILLVSLIKLLARIPFLQSAVISSLSALVGYVSLHWIGPLEIYLEDYTRSAAMRQRFDRELEAFLGDGRCERLVVIAHSMGTVIAYEGLTTALNQSAARAGRKPVTFICLGQALRRMWLLAGEDNHRLRRVMPDYVRWLDIWARYDPIPAGPLTRSALPRLAAWTDPTTPDPHDAICDTLDRLENVDVVNRDSLFTDHTTYWNNMEQVVGPIALELVRGHPAMEAHVRGRLATPDRVLWRRWQIAWRATTALVGAAGATALFLWRESVNNWPVGDFLRRNAPGFLVGELQNLIGLPLQPLAPAISGLNQLLNQIFGFDLGSVRQYFRLLLDTPVSRGGPPAGATVYSVVAALVGFGVLIAGIGRLIAPPSPFKPAANNEAASHGMFRLAQITLALSFVVAALSSDGFAGHFSGGHLQLGGPNPSPLYKATASAALFILAAAALVTWIWGLLRAARRGHWIWVLANLLLPLATIVNVVQVSVYIAHSNTTHQLNATDVLLAAVQTNAQINYVAVAVLTVALVGSFVGLADLVEARRWALALVFCAGTLLLACTLLAQAVAALAVLQTPQGAGAVDATHIYVLPEPFGTFENIFYPWLFIVAGAASFIGYGLWSGLMSLRTRRVEPTAAQRAAFVTAFIGMALVTTAPAISGLFTSGNASVGATCAPGLDCTQTPAWVTAIIAAAALASLAAYALSLADSLRTRQLSWFLAIGAGAALLAVVFSLTGRTAGVPNQLIYPALYASLVYGLWGGRPIRKVARGPDKGGAARR